LATKFKELMKLKGYTQTQLSKISGVAQSNLSIYCNHRETLEVSTMVTRARLAGAFSMTVKEFEEYLDLEPATLIASNKQTGNFTLHKN